MRVLSVNVGLPAEVPVKHGSVLTSIFKTSVEGRRAVRRNNIDGDRQADLTVHGGPHKAVYCYPAEHYQYWRQELPGTALPNGMFGENLTTEGITEDDVFIGDQFRAGSALLQITQPRMPCFKLQIRFDRDDMVKKFWHSGRPGIYFSVAEEGDVAPGDSMVRVARGSEEVSVGDVVRLYRGEETSPLLMDRALRSPLFGGWKQGLREHRRP